MVNTVPYAEPKFLRFVDDFEALADSLQARIEQERFRTMPEVETQFTTEWQMSSTEEEVSVH